MKELLLQKAQQLKTESEEIEQKLKFVTEQIMDLEKFVETLKDLNNSKNEILANLGHGVYTKASQIPNEKLFVEVGSNVVLRKTPQEVQKIVESQILKFREARVQLSIELESYAYQFNEMLKQVQSLKA